jgi:hypothetical protein
VGLQHKVQQCQLLFHVLIQKKGAEKLGKMVDLLLKCVLLMFGKTKNKNYFIYNFIGSERMVSEIKVQLRQLNVITDNIIIRLMVPVSPGPKVITLNFFHCKLKRISINFNGTGQFKENLFLNLFSITWNRQGK